MTLYFHEPPPPQRVGGLELAVRSLEAYLLASGIPVKSESDFASATGNVSDAVVHFHGLWQPQFLRASRRCRARGIPYVVSPHGMLEPWAWRHKRWKKWPYFLLFERSHLRGAASFLATSDMEAHNLRKFFPRSKCAVIPLGLPDLHPPDYPAARQRLGWQPTEKVLLFLSRIHPKKGLDLLLEALAALAPGEVKGLRLVVIGGGAAAYINRLRALVEQRKAHLPRVDWLGEIWGENKWSFLQGADLFCLPSFSENFGLAVLEALQVGTRVLTTNAGPWEFLPGWNAGLIVQPRADSVQQGLRAFFAWTEWTDQQRLSLAERVRNKFGWETVGPEYLSLYRNLGGGTTGQLDHRTT